MLSDFKVAVGQGRPSDSHSSFIELYLLHPDDPVMLSDFKVVSDLG